MNTEQFLLVRKSWDNIAKINFEIIGGIFYMRLFEIAPQLRPMFKHTVMKEQAVKLGCMLSYVIAKFDSMDAVIAEVAALAERHRKYGVKNEHYQPVGNALFWTLEKGLGDYWTKDLENAWIEFYKQLSGIMMDHNYAHRPFNQHEA